MKKKIVLITGTTSGIGEELRLLYNKNNYKTISVNRIDSKKNESRNNISYYIDITSQLDIDNLIEDIKKNNIQPDIYIFNAGVNKPDFENIFRKKIFEEVLNINFFSINLFLESIKKYDLKNKVFIFISSFSTIFPNKNNVSYYFSKYLINRLYQSQNWIDKNNLYKIVYLGPVKTNIKRHIKDEKKLNRFFFNLLSINKSYVAKKIFNFSLNSKKRIIIPYRVFLFYTLIKLLAFFRL